jgi:hypothetical protein
VAKLIKKLGKDGVLYAPIDVPDGEYGAKEIAKRTASRLAQYKEEYGNPDAGDSLKALSYPKPTYPGKSWN